MNDDAFARLVAEEVKNKVSRSQRNILMEKQNWDKWRRALGALVDTLNDQLETLAEDEESDRKRYESLGSDGAKLLAESMAEYETRRSRIERFLFHVERRLDEVENMIKTGTIDNDPSKNALLYENAIKKHKAMIEEYDIEPTPVDTALWEALEGKWAFNKIKPEDIANY
jgi:hypothetical protein